MAAERDQSTTQGAAAPKDAQRGARDATRAPGPIQGSEDAPGAARTEAAMDNGGAAARLVDAARAHTVAAWRAAVRWLRVNSWLPAWLPIRWRHWGVAYLAAALSQALAITIITLTNGLFPSLLFQGALDILVIVVVALTFGAGPSLLTTLLGAALLDFFALPPHLAWSLSSPAYLMSLSLFVVIGYVASVLASQTERARSIAEAARERTERLAFALADERARLEAVIEASPDRVAIFDEQGRIVRLNAAAQLAAGPERGAEGLPEYQQAYGLKRPSGEPWAVGELPVAQALRGETVTDVEMLYRDSDERERTILTSVAPIRDATGQTRGAIAITHDITALREIQQAAVERASQLDSIIESMADAIFVYDAHGGIMRTNAAARKLFGFDAQPRFATMSLSERLPLVEARDDQGQTLPVEQSPQSRILRGETLAGDTAMDCLLRLLDGRDVAVNITGAPVRSADGKMRGGILILRDVTEQRRLQARTREALDAVLAMAQALVELPPDIRSDGQGSQDEMARGGLEVAQRIARLTCRVLGCARVGILAVDPETERLRAIAVVGLTPEQERQWWVRQRESERRGVRLGDGSDPRDLFRLLSGEALVIDMTQPPYAYLPNPYGISTSLAAPMLIGSQIVGILSLDYGGPPHSFTADEIKLAGGVAQLGAVVLERDRLLRERAEAQASLLAAQEANQRMDEFLSVAGHELKTPITTARVNLQLIERRMRRLNGELARLDESASAQITPIIEPFRELIQRADSATRRQSRLVEDLLDVSRLQSGQLDLQIETCDLVALVRDCVEDQRLTWPERLISATLPEGTAPVAADPDRITQVIANFLTNALKYSPGDAPVSVTLTREDGTARVSVTDHGPGIAEAAQAHLWDRFYRAPGVEVRNGSGVGLGLGLYICHEIIERHGGEIGVESQPGDGSVFWFTLPLKRAADGR
ncbi:MAG TPA: ATP-binding protein [Ktedonobacterales bacterium]|nr:ATP-binding protein [Ktedonobacterales bacterium]